MRSERFAGIAMIVASAIGFGALGVFARLADDDGADQAAVLALRFGITGLAFATIRLVRWVPRPRGKALGGLAVMGVAYFVQGQCYFASVDRGSPGLASLLLYAYPALVVLLGAVVLGERPRPTVIAACGVALAGTAMIIAPTASGGNPSAIAFGLTTSVTYSTYILIGSRVLERVDPIWASTVIMGTAGLCSLALYLAVDPRPSVPGSAEGWWAVIGIVVLSTILPVSLFLAGLARIGPADASTLSSIEPVTSVVLSAIVIGEELTRWTIVGGLLVAASVIAIGRLGPTEIVEPVPQA